MKVQVSAEVRFTREIDVNTWLELLVQNPDRWDATRDVVADYIAESISAAGEIDALIAEEIHDITVYKTHLNDTEWAWWLILIAKAQLPKPIPGQRDIFGGEVAS